MATPTISEYTAHLREDKATMRNHLLSANIETKESDTFTDLSKKVLEKSNAIRNIYVQPNEPLGKDGIWINRDTAVTDFDAVSTSGPYVDETVLAQTNAVAPLTSISNYAIHFRQNVNDFYAIQYRSSQGSGTDILDTTTPVIYIYKYNKTARCWDLKQSYTFNEFVGARGNAYTTASNPTTIQRLWGNNNSAVHCWAPDADGNYLYHWGGTTLNNSSLNYGQADSKPIVRLGISSHSCSKIRESKYGSPRNSAIFLHNNCLYSIFPQPGVSYGSGVYCTTSIIANDDTQDRYIKNLARRGGSITPYDGTNQIFQLNGMTSGNSSSPPNVLGIDLDTHTAFMYHGRGGSGGNTPGYFDTMGYRRVGSYIYYIENLAWNNYKKVHKKYSLLDIAKPGVEISRTTFSFNGDVLCYLDSTNNQLVYIPKIANSNPVEWKLNLLGNTYTKNTVVLAQSKSNYDAYHTNLYTTNQFVSDLKYAFEDAWFYGENTGYEKTLPVYYGDGTQWIKFKN